MVRDILKNRIAKNAFWIIGCKAAEAVIGFLISLLTARYFGPANYGVLNYAASLTLFLTPLAQLGMNQTMVTELVRNPEREGEIIGTGVFMSFLSGLACIAGISLFVRLASPEESMTILVCELYSLMLIAQATELIQYWFQAKLHSKYIAVITLIAYAAASVYQIFLLAAGKRVEWFTFTKTAEYLLISIFSFLMYRKLGGLRLKLSRKTASEMLKRSRFYMFSSFMVMTFAQADRIMIKMMIGDAAVGYYSAAVFCANMTDFVFLAIIDSFRPVLLKKRAESKVLFEDGMTVLYFIVIVFALVQSIIISFFARSIIRILYGAAYLPATGVLRIIVWYTTFSYIGSARVVWIQAEEKQKFLCLINFCGAAVNILLNAFLIPLWGIEGAAFASLFTQFFTNVVIGFILKPLRENNLILLAACNPKRTLKNCRRT